MSGVGSSPALATCETSQVLLAGVSGGQVLAGVSGGQVLAGVSGVSGGFSRGSPVFAPPTDWPVSYELK